MSSVDNLSIALALSQHLMTAAANAVTLINQARLEGRPITNDELAALASEDDLARAELAAEIARTQAVANVAAHAKGAGAGG